VWDKKIFFKLGVFFLGGGGGGGVGGGGRGGQLVGEGVTLMVVP